MHMHIYIHVQNYNSIFCFDDRMYLYGTFYEILTLVDLYL